MKGKKQNKTVSKLIFTEEELADLDMEKPLKKVLKVEKKLNKAHQKIGAKSLNSREKTLKMNSVKKPVKLRFENLEVKKSSLPSATGLPSSIIHQQIRENEDDNVGVEAGHRLGATAERTVRGAKNAHRAHGLSQKRKALHAEKALDKANVDYLYRERAGKQGKTTSNPISKWQQKQTIKKEYAAAKRAQTTGKTINSSSKTKKALKKTKDSGEKIAAFVARHKKALLIIGAIFITTVLIMNMVTSCSQLALGSLNAFVATSYTASDEDITASDLEYSRLEAELEYELLTIERSHPGYDEYRYSLDPIGHDPNELIAYLTARFEDFTYLEIRSELHSLFSAMYSLSITETVEVRYKTETRYYSYTVTDPETGETETYYDSYEVEVPYNYYILNIDLKSNSLYSVVFPRMNTDEGEMYLVYMDTRGNKAYFGNPFDFNWSSRVTSLYGWRIHPISQNLQVHRGLDLAVPLGTSIQAIHEGRVIRVAFDPDGYGHYLTIEDKDGYRSTYAHCSNILVNEGDHVVRGQAIARAGSTGASTGSHLHLELTYQGQYLNPYFFIEGADPYLPPALGAGNGAYTNYDIPPEALSDPVFAALINEAEKYLGYPYVWGGSTPATSFDCSGFVCWVFQNSGIYPLSRTTAQGIFNQCAAISPAEAKPGDIIFFTGTYNSPGPVSHVAIYVGDGMMIHAGKPIQYASINTPYWQSHFYAFGRLPRR